MDEHPTKDSLRTFETRNLSLAAFLISGRHLEYLNTHLQDRRGVFTFADPRQQGPLLEAEFHSGALAPATIFHSVVKRLRREIDMALAGGAR